MTLETIERLKQIHNYKTTEINPQSRVPERNQREFCLNKSDIPEKLTFGIQPSFDDDPP